MVRKGSPVRVRTRASVARAGSAGACVREDGWIGTRRVHRRPLGNEEGVLRFGRSRLVAADREAANPQSARFEHSDATRSQVALNCVEIGEEQRDLTFGASLGPVSEQKHGWSWLQAECQQRSEIRVGGNDDPRFVGSAGEDLLVACRLKSIGTDVNGVVPSVVEALRHQRRDCVVDEELQPPEASGSSRSRTASAAYCRASRMSSTSRSGRAARISASLIPSAAIPTTVATGILSARIHGAPPI